MRSHLTLLSRCFLVHQHHHSLRVNRLFVSKSTLLVGDLVHALVLLSHLVDLGKLLQLLLVLHLLLQVGILHVLSYEVGLVLELFLLFLQSLLLEIGDQHSSLLSFYVQELSNCTLDLDSSEVLGCHWSTPRLLDDSL
jgi:hypothetical protein